MRGISTTMGTVPQGLRIAPPVMPPAKATVHIPRDVETPIVPPQSARIAIRLAGPAPLRQATTAEALGAVDEIITHGIL